MRVRIDSQRSVTGIGIRGDDGGEIRRNDRLARIRWSSSGKDLPGIGI